MCGAVLSIKRMCGIYHYAAICQIVFGGSASGSSSCRISLISSPGCVLAMRFHSPRLSLMSLTPLVSTVSGSSEGESRRSEIRLANGNNGKTFQDFSRISPALGHENILLQTCMLGPC